jgi:Flp pilus assembly protein TadB
MLIGLLLAILLGGSMYIRAAQKNMARLLPEALGIMGNEIAAGHSIEAAVQRVALQFGKPLSQEFTDALVKMTASGGLISIDQALAEIAQNPLYQSDALDQAALTISVVRPLGGDLGSLLSDLSKLLYEREATEREIRTQLAPGRQAAWSLVFIICGLFVALTLFPLFRDLLYGLYTGRFVLIVATVMISIAVFWIIRINSYDL